MIALAALAMATAAQDASRVTAPPRTALVRLDLTEAGVVDRCTVMRTDAHPEVARRMCESWIGQRYAAATGPDGRPRRSTMTETITINASVGLRAGK